MNTSYQLGFFRNLAIRSTLYNREYAYFLASRLLRAAQITAGIEEVEQNNGYDGFLKLRLNFANNRYSNFLYYPKCTMIAANCMGETRPDFIELASVNDISTLFGKNKQKTESIQAEPNGDWDLLIQNIQTVAAMPLIQKEEALALA